MKDKLVWQYLIPLMSRIPILKKLAIRLTTKKLAKYFIQSLKNYEDVLHNETLDNPLLSVVKPYMAIMALMPAAMIYGYVKDAKQEAVK